MATESLFALVSREAIEREPGPSRIMDPDWLFAGPVNDDDPNPELALLLFRNQWDAERLATVLGRIDLVPVAFVDAADCLRCLLHYQAKGFKWVIVDRWGQMNHECNIPIESFVEHVRADTELGQDY